MYRTLNSYLQETFGCKVYKLSLDGGMTCPNRDGTCGTGGCIFCSGSGEFAARGATVAEQLLDGTLQPGDTARLIVENDQLCVTK